MKTWTEIQTTLVVLVLSVFAGCQSPEPGYFSAEQAVAGEAVYATYCASCHHPDLSGSGLVTALAGPEVVSNWATLGWTADDLFYVIRANMPPGSARSLSDDERLAVLAFMLRENGLPAGQTPLRAEADYLNSLSFRTAEEESEVTPAPPEYVEGDQGLEPLTSTPTPAELRTAGGRPENWIYHTGDYGGRRFSGLDQINATNVAGLAVTCSYSMPEQGNFQTGPLVYEGVMFVTGVHETVALDAATCEEKWTHVWSAPAGDVWLNNRGVALSEGRVVRATSDGYLLALDASTGSLLWARKVADAALGETFTMAPLIWEDLIVVGPAGSENAIQGWVGAFSVRDGAPVWRFNIVPRVGEPGYDTWDHTNDFPIGGGATWTPFSMDTEAGVVFVAATNPAPDFPAELRGGDNLYTNSALALNARTGELLWHQQMVPQDDHDWDLTQVSPVFRGRAGGRVRDLLGTVGKDGVFRLLDRSTQERLWETAVTMVDNGEMPVTVEGTFACPGVLGGVEWNGPAYHPESHMLFVPAVDWCGTFFAADTIRYVRGANYLGGTYMADPLSQGWLTAIDVESGEVVWDYLSERPMVGAVTATAGDLVLAGELTGDLVVFRPRTGEELARFPVGAPIGGGIVTYAVEGRQYIAVASGSPSGFWADASAGRPTVVILSLPQDP